MSWDQARRLRLSEQHEWFRRRAGVASHSTGVASRDAGVASRDAGVRATPMLLTTAEAPAGRLVRPVGRHLAFGADPTSQVSVAWQVPAPVRSPFLRIGESPSDLSQRIAAEIRTVAALRTDGCAQPSASGPTGERHYLHAMAERLEPGRTYHYSVGHQGADDPRAGWTGTFTTAPSNRQPFTFTAFGDQGVSPAAVGMPALIQAQAPAFHLHAGDISYADSSGRGLVTDSYDSQVWDSFFAQIEPAAARVPWQIAVGNHEMEAWYSADGYGAQRARFDFPGHPASSTPDTYYSLRYGNVGIVSLDANDVSYEIPANRGYSDGAQTSWLAGTLAALRGDPDVDFVVAFFHHCGYCTCTAHGSEGGVREHWAPLFDQYEVDLVINGHNHIFERTDPLKGGSPTGAAPAGSTIRPATEGTTYITAGSGGVGLYEFPASDSYAGRVSDADAVASHVSEADDATARETVTWSRVRYTGYCLLVLDSRPGEWPGADSTLTVRGLAADGAEIDRITLARSASLISATSY